MRTQHRSRPAALGLCAALLLAGASFAQPSYLGPTFLSTPGSGFLSGNQLGDIEGDGDLDIVCFRGNDLVVMRNDGNASFTSAVTPGLGGSPFFRLGDIDGDGDLDIIKGEPGAVRIYRNTGTTFTLVQSITISGGLGRTVATLRLNPLVDNDLDFVVIETSGGVGRIRRYENDGTGQFSYTGVAGSLSGFNGNQVHAADMDGDGDEDLVAVYQGGFQTPHRLYVLYSNGNGTFPSSFVFQLSDTAYNSFIALADVTGDGRPDVVSEGNDDIVTYVNSGSGTIASTLITPSSLSDISGLDVADIDGDGALDVLATDSTSPYAAEFFGGNGSGSFTPALIPLTGTNPNPCCLQLGDLNGDGSPDAVIPVLGGSAPTLGILLFGAEAVNFRKVMITEASWGNPDFIEITNFGLGTANLSGWTVRWKDGSTAISSPLAITLAPGEPAIIGESGTTNAGLGLTSAIQVVAALPSIGTTTSDFAVALVDAGGDVVDEVRVSSTSGGYAEGGLGGYFRGAAIRTNASNGSVERIWGLDSNGGTDWTAQGTRSPGYENLGSGPRGTDPVPVPVILINETDDSPDLIELRNPGSSDVDLQGWTLWCSASQNGSHAIIAPFTTSTVIAAGGYLVIGESAAPPSEMPAGVPYVDSPQNIPWVSSEYDCALYDDLGRLVDLMRTTQATSDVVHNHPRAPAHWSAFRGAAGRLDGGGDDAVGRTTASDTDRGGDFEPVYTRTMGSANTAFASFDRGFDSELDVRFNDHGLHGGHSLIVNAGAANAGNKFSYLFSVGHANGTGPIVGLGLDAIDNWVALRDIFPFGAPLDADGAHTIHFPPVTTLPSGFDADVVCVLQSPSGAFLSRTLVIEFDTF